MGTPCKAAGGTWFKPVLLLLLLSAAAYAQSDSAWMFRYPETGQGDYQPLASFVDDTGYVYVAGWKGEWGKHLDMFLIKVDSLGRLVWTRGYDSLEAVGAARDTCGNTYIAGDQEGGRVCLMKYGPDGDMKWFAICGRTAQRAAALHGVAIDDSQNVYVGALSWSASNNIIHILKYRPNGTLAGEVSSQLHQRAILLEDRFHVLDNGDVYLVTNSERPDSSALGDYDWFAAKLSGAHRVFVWVV